jgi:long-chain acyl-CoA synthetase
MIQSNLDLCTTISDYLNLVFTKYGSNTLFKIKRRYRKEFFSYNKIYNYLKSADSFYNSLEIKKRDKILVLGYNSPELATFILSCFYSNRVVIPADIKSSKELLEKYFTLTKPKLVFTSRKRSADISSFTNNFLIIEDYFHYLDNYPAKKELSHLPKPDDLAEIVFTSGTTGIPKGVMLSHKNIISNIFSFLSLLPEMKHYESVSILPLSHMFEQTVGLITPLCKGATVNYLNKVNSFAIRETLNDNKISHLVVVPQLLKNLYNNIELEAEKNKYKAIFEKLQNISSFLPFIIRKLIFYKIHKALGGNIKFIISASAKLDLSLAKKWDRLGFKIIEGYGATEVTAGATANKINDIKFGSVGLPLSGVNIKISENGEILIKGPNVSKGYYKNNKKTKEVFTKDGWYRTGDIGKIIDERLYLLGRDSFKIVLESGKKVYVEDLESILNEQPEIWESCVIPLDSNNSEIVHAVLIPKKGYFKNDIDSAVVRINSNLEAHQQILSYSLFNESDFPRTNTLKTDRKKVKDIIQKMLHPTLLTNNDNDYLSNIPYTSYSRLVKLISEVTGIPVKNITEKSNLGIDLKMDSINRLELIALIEYEFDIFINDYAISNQTTITDLHKMITSTTNSPPVNPINISFYNFPITFLRLILLKTIFFPFFSYLVKTKIDGLNNLKNIHEPSIFAYNHIGPFDNVCFLKYLSSKQILNIASAASENFWNGKNRFGEWFIQFIGSGFPITADNSSGVKSSLEKIGKLLDMGFSITIAPEGQISRSGNMHRFKRGIGVIAVEMNAPIIPIKIEGDYSQVFHVPKISAHKVPISSFIPDFSKRVHVKIKVGKPIKLNKCSYTLATEILEDAIRKL